MATPKRIGCFLVFLALIFVSVSDAAAPKTPPKGHLQRLGAHRDPDPPVDELSEDQQISPQDFWTKYVVGRKPLILRGHGKQHPAYKLWTEKYVRENYGHLNVRLEHKNESIQLLKELPTRASINDFLDKHQDIGYVISQMPSNMTHETVALPCISCGPVADSFTEINFWLSSGGTHSLVHKDAPNQMNCLLEGKKEWKLIAPDQIKHIPWQVEDAPKERATAGRSKINPLMVDLVKYPDMVNMRYQEAVMHGGDCIYVPGSYLHQVYSPKGRNIAVSVLFGGPTAVDNPDSNGDETWTGRDCPEKAQKKPLSTMFVAWPYDGKGPMTYGNSPPGAAVALIQEQPIEKFTKETFAKFWREEMNEFMGSDQSFRNYSLQWYLDELELLIPDRPRSSWKTRVVQRGSDEADDVVAIIGMKKAAVDAAVKIATAWFAKKDPDNKGLTKKDFMNLRPPEIMTGLKGYFHLESLNSRFKRTYEGGEEEEDDDDDAVRGRERGGRERGGDREEEELNRYSGYGNGDDGGYGGYGGGNQQYGNDYGYDYYQQQQQYAGDGAGGDPYGYDDYGYDNPDSSYKNEL